MIAKDNTRLVDKIALAYLQTELDLAVSNIFGRYSPNMKETTLRKELLVYIEQGYTVDGAVDMWEQTNLFGYIAKEPNKPSNVKQAKTDMSFDPVVKAVEAESDTLVTIVCSGREITLPASKVYRKEQ